MSRSAFPDGPGFILIRLSWFLSRCSHFSDFLAATKMTQKEDQLINLNVMAVERVDRLLKRVARELAHVQNLVVTDAEVIDICTENSLKSCTLSKNNIFRR